ncbi:MAG TPA: MoxR family ATPase [Polyangiaceae bacterium]|jgi:MoxR-like ATPase|nr:MoxR family ATPase [Polyangiaceae bacterium]
MPAPSHGSSGSGVVAGPADAAALAGKLAAAGYLASEELALVVWLALTLERPLLVEGPAGVGKTDLARALAEGLARELVRLQCYEGLDEARALYEWDYAKQMLYTQLLREAVASQVAGAANLGEAADRVAGADAAFFSRRFLIERPLLRALSSEQPVLMLIDEVDRADPEFEAFLLEILAERQATIPEIGTVRARSAPLFLLTSNGTRDMSDALRRRCLHAFVDYPPPAREQAILELRVPGLAQRLAEQLTAFVRDVRAMDLEKAPSIAETIDWARALVLLGASALDDGLARSTLGVLLKYEGDRVKVASKLPKRA